MLQHQPLLGMSSLCWHEITANRWPRVPIFEIWRQATSSDVAATVFLVSLLLMAVFALNGSQQTASRLTWSFARDNAIFGSRWLNKISPNQDVPIFALIFNFAIMFIIGCIYSKLLMRSPRHCCYFANGRLSGCRRPGTSSYLQSLAGLPTWSQSVLLSLCSCFTRFQSRCLSQEAT